MKTYQKIALYATLAAGLAGIAGCKETPKDYRANDPKSAFALIPTNGESPALISGDFDGDGDLDFIVGAQYANQNPNAALYLFINDGKGNFTVKAPQTPAEKMPEGYQ